MKHLIIAPRFASKGQSYDFPLGIAYISSALKHAGYDVRCLNLNHEDGTPAEAVARAVEEFAPDVCGCGGLSPHLEQVQSIFAAARRVNPSIVNIVGGGLFSSDPETVLDMLDADIGVIGEGEQTILEVAEALANGASMERIKGIGFKNADGVFTRNAPRPPNHDLDHIPWPDYEGFQAGKLIELASPVDNYFFDTGEKPRSISMIASRSCPFSCSFCFHPTGRVYRNRGLDSFFEELDSLVAKHNINMLAILDEIFAVKKNRLLKFCERIEPYNIKWMVQLHVGVIDEEVIARMKAAGCVYISYGIESMNDTVLESMQKKATRKQIERALKITHDHNIGIQGNLIFGDSAETLETANDTMDWWANNRKYLINLSRLQVYPGSPIYQDAMAKGMIKDKMEIIRKPFLNTTAIDDETFKNMLNRVLVFMESLVSPAKVISFEKQPLPDPDRGDLYRIEWLCPRCQAVNVYANIPNDRAHTFQSFKFTCRQCLSRSNIQNMARSRLQDPEADEMVRQAAQLRQAGNIRKTARTYMNILQRNKDLSSFGDKPEAIVQAAFELGNLLLQQNKTAEAIYYLSVALACDSYNPIHHTAYALALIAEGSFDAARLHVQQARILLNDEEALSAQILAMEKIIASTPSDRLTYFT